MKRATLDHILKRPAMYCGGPFTSLEHFSAFFCGLSLGISGSTHFSQSDAEAIAQFGAFMRHYLHGENKNCHWVYDLLSREGSHERAIEKASILMQIFRDQLESRGIEHSEEIIANASKTRVFLTQSGEYAEDAC